jgi:mono/diheme cytochrome c family protein
MVEDRGQVVTGVRRSAGFLFALALSHLHPAVAQTVPAGLSPFAAAKARRLLAERLPCLGCHELNGDGGAVGPPLTGVGGRLDAAAIREVIRDPQRVRPASAMPRVRMPKRTLDLIVTYLAGEPGGGAARAPGPAPAQPVPATSREPEALYRRFCAPCHGEGGAGDGYNAARLPQRPTAHSSRRAMGARSDDALYDAIAAGGRVMGRSPRMPPFGATLSPEEIRGLVRYLRALCRCEGPAWAAPIE